MNGESKTVMTAPAAILWCFAFWLGLVVLAVQVLH
jgi:hypothetical protein